MQEHSMFYLEMAFRNDRRGIIANPDGYGKRTGDCADTVEIYIKEGFEFEKKGVVNWPPRIFPAD